jgi:hypothetical protein
MVFSIEVKKKGKNEEFSFEDLEMIHADCYGGKIGKQYDKKEKSWWLTCARCGQSIKIFTEGQTSEIVRTAIDGKERILDYEPFNAAFDVYVVQKR